MSEEFQRRSTDPLISEMHGDIKLILSRQEDTKAWQLAHEQEDNERFKELTRQMTLANNEILIAKTKATTVAWILGSLFTLITALIEFVRWSYRK